MFDLKRTAELVKGALLEPEPTWERYLPEADDWKRTAVLLTGPLIVAAPLVAWVLRLVTGGFAGVGLPLVWLLVAIINGALAVTVVTFIVSSLASMFGAKYDFGRGLAATTLAFVPGYLGQALSGLPWIGGVIALGFAIYALVLLWRIIPFYLDVPTEKRAPHYALSLIASGVTMFVVSAILFGGPNRPANNPGMNVGAMYERTLSRDGISTGDILSHRLRGATTSLEGLSARSV